MSYYIGATGEYIWEELLDNATSNVVIATNINFDANPLTEAIQQTITDALGTAVGELIAPITEVPSATGVGVVALTALGLLSYYKLNRTAVQDVDSMVYSADYASILTPGMYDDRVRIRYNTNQFSNAFYYDGATKKGEILTSRINLLPVDSNNIDLYTSTGKIGIGTATPATPLHIYHATDNILRLQTATNGKVSIEFARGTNIDVYTDYRFINDLGTFKLQYEDNAIGYGDTGTNLFTILPNKINLFKDTEVFANVGIGTTPSKPLHIYNATSAMIKLHTATGGIPSIEFVRGADDDAFTDYIMGNYTGVFKISGRNLTTTTDRIVIGETGNVGIGTTQHATYKLDVLGDIRATAFRGDGANITGLNQDNLTLTTAKIYEKFNQTTFSVINDKINISPDVGSYTFNIIAYDRMYQTTAPTYLLSGKFTCIYEDRTGVFTLRPSEQITNKLILDYKVGDKLTFKNTALPLYDYLNDVNAFGETIQRWGKLILFKIANGTNWTGQGEEAYMTKIYEWKSETNQLINHSQGGAIYPWASTISLTLETGFKYFLVKWWYNVDANYHIAPANEENQMNATNYGGQGFKMITAYSGTLNYIPQTPTPLPVMTTTTHGVALRGARLSLNTETATLSADIPTSADLITNMNTSHFTNNTGTSKIDISSSYVAPNATKLANIRTIAGVNFDGTGNIDIPYTSLTSIPATWGTSQIPDLGAGKITSGTFTTDRIPDLGAGKINSGTFDVLRIPDLGAGKINSGTFDVLRIPDLAISKISLLQGALDGKQATLTAGGGINIVGNTISAPAGTTTWLKNTTKVYYNEGNVGIGTTDPQTTLDIRGTSPTIKLLDTRTDGDAVIQFREASDLFGMDISYIGNLDNRMYIRSYNNSATAVNHIAINRSDGYVGIGSTAPATPLHIYNATNATLRLQTTGTADASIELIRGTNADTSTDWIMTNKALTGGLHISSSVSGTPTDRFVITNGGNVGIGTTDPQYNLDIQGTFPVIKLLAPTAGSSFIKFFEQNETFGYDMGYNGSANRFVFRSFDNSATPVEHLTISRGIGRFGIGGIPATLSRMKVYGVGTEILLAEFLLASGASGINITNTAIATAGTDANISLNLQSKGTGGIFLQAPAGTTRITINGSTGGVSIGGTLSAGATTITGNSAVIGTLEVGSATAELLISGNAITAQGSDANIPLSFQTKGTSAFSIRTGATPTTRLSITDAGLVSIGGGLNTGSITSTGAITATTNISCGTIASFTRISAGSIFVDGNDVSIPLSISAKGVGALTLSTNTTARLTINSAGLATFANDVSITGTNTTTGNSTLTGNVGIGKAPSLTYKVDVLGDVNVSGNFRIGGNIINSTASVWTTSGVNIYSNNTGNVGIGTNDPLTYKLNVNGNSFFNNVMNFNTQYNGGGADFACNKINLWGTGGNYGFGISGGTLDYFTSTTHRWLYGGGGTNFGTQGMALTNNNLSVGGNVNMGSATINGDKVVGGNSFQRNTYLYSGNEGSAVIQYFATPFTGAPSMAKSMIMALPISSYSRHHLLFCLNTFANNDVAVSTSDEYFRLHTDGYIQSSAQLRVFNEIFGGFYSVSRTNTDYICVQGDYSANNAYGTRWLRVAFESFTAFHRCYTDDELCNNETDEDIDIFKNNYMGRVVIATGKIKTDLSRMIDEERGEDAPEYVEPEKSKKQTPEWYNAMDKDGISVEDAIPVIALSRKKKDKRVFGVLGDPKRSSNNKDRVIVNSIGEGAICVSNTNGNIENGDYIQSSDLLGYGEKQDDDLLHNYTIAKATIDCNFELDSPYYQSHEIENGVRVAFIACSYHCG